jgi:hypothetical protein
MTHTMIPRTNYLMEQEPSLMQAQAGSDGGWYCWQDRAHSIAESDLSRPSKAGTWCAIRPYRLFVHLDFEAEGLAPHNRES